VQFYFRERGWRQNQTNDPALGWYKGLFPSTNFDTIKTVLDAQKYVILCGPPGTKKTDILTQIVGKFQDSVSYQFHPSVTYQMFVGGIQPILKNFKNSKDGSPSSHNTADVGFEYSIGPLLLAIDKADKNKSVDTLLALDEINRADLSSVLGEAIQLFEPDQKYKLTIKNYNDGKPIEMPSNLKVLATMNTADRNISYIDVAIRRRFAFINIWPDEPNGEKSCTYGKEWFNKCKMLFLEYGENSDLQLMPGGYYFLGKTDEEVKNCFKYRLIPLLEDYLNENRLTQKMKYELDMYLQELRREI
jgi:5-methylcytosine-specific restriction protein B